MANLTSLYKWFDTNRDAIIAGHEREEVLLKNKKVVGYFKTEQEALQSAKRNGFKFGAFLIQSCVPAEEETLACFSPAVQFA